MLTPRTTKINWTGDFCPVQIHSFNFWALHHEPFKYTKNAAKNASH